MIFVNLIQTHKRILADNSIVDTWKKVFLGRPITHHSLFRLVIIAAFLALAAATFNPNHPQQAQTPQNKSITIASPMRVPNAMAVPDLERTNDVDDILDSYPAYLRFVLIVGKRTKKKTAIKLENTYLKLKKRNKKFAATFLKGLRIEIMHKLQLIGLPPHRATTRHPVMREWVAKYIGEWHREADEYLFRSIALNAQRKK